MILFDDLADHPGALRVFPVGEEPLLLHGVKDAALHRLEAVTHIGQGPVHDDRHRIVDKARFDLVCDSDRNDLTLSQGDTSS